MTNFTEVINGLYAQYDGGALQDINDRMEAIEEAIEQYYRSSGKFPSPGELDRLTTLILREELSDTRSNKMKVVEHPIMSARWEKSRTDREVSIQAAENVGIDRRSYRKPTRNYKRKH